MISSTTAQHLVHLRSLILSSPFGSTTFLIASILFSLRYSLLATSSWKPSHVTSCQNSFATSRSLRSVGSVRLSSRSTAEANMGGISLLTKRSFSAFARSASATSLN